MLGVRAGEGEGGGLDLQKCLYIYISLFGGVVTLAGPVVHPSTIQGAIAGLSSACCDRLL